MPAGSALRRLLVAAPVAALVLGIVGSPDARAQATAPRVPQIAAASDLKFALEEIGGTYARTSGRKVALTFGSSGNFARQLLQGAPFELFLSADEGFVFRLADAGLTVDRGELYAIGRVSLFVPKGSRIALDPELRGVREALGSIQRFSIANPEHAPYGRAAREVLSKLGLWDAMQPRLVLGENVTQAAQYVATGAAQAGLIAFSLALAGPIERAGDSIVLPDTLHSPLRQRMVLMKNHSAEARAFHDYLRQPPARELFKKYGFALPGEG